MGWIGRPERQVLARIVALLLALAVLADRAGAAPFPVRFIVLTILRHAEAVAWRFIATAAHAPSRAGIEAPVPCHDSRAEAARLALGLRLLALVVAELAAQAPAAGAPGWLRNLIRAGTRPVVHAPAALPAHDTS